MYEFWDSSGIGNTTLCGWWQHPSCAAATTDPDVKLTTYAYTPTVDASSEATGESASVAAAAAATPYAVLAVANFGSQVTIATV